MRHDDRPSVEFLVSGPDTGTDDEDLAQPEGFPRLRRARLPLVVAGAVGLLALVVVSVVNGPSGSPSAAPATVTVAPSSTSTPIAGGPVQQPLGSVVLPDETCPLAASCAVLFTTPHRVAAAVHAALPSVTRLRTVTTTMHGDLPGSQLLTRKITGRVRTAHLSVTLTPEGRRDRIGWNASEDAARTLVTATRHVQGRLVTVQLTAPPGYDVGIAAVRRLAADPRLSRLD